jgi:hypothetical protein
VVDHIHAPAFLYPGKEFVLHLQGKLSLLLRNATRRHEMVGGKAPRILDLDINGSGFILALVAYTWLNNPDVYWIQDPICPRAFLGVVHGAEPCSSGP